MQFNYLFFRIVYFRVLLIFFNLLSNYFSNAGRDDSGIQGSRRYRFGRKHIGIYALKE